MKFFLTLSVSLVVALVASCGVTPGEPGSRLSARARESGQSVRTYGKTYGAKTDLSDLGLPGLLWHALSHHKQTGLPNPGGKLSCKDESISNSVRQTCLFEKEGSRVDHVECLNRNMVLDDSAAKKADFNSDCTLTTSTWPVLSPEVSEFLASALAPTLVDGASGFEVGKTKKLKCALQLKAWSCELAGFEASAIDDFEFVEKYKAPKLAKVVIAPGTNDVDGAPLPTGPKEIALILPSGTIEPQRYVASDVESADYLAGQTKESSVEAKDRIKELNYTGKCRLSEIHALIDYTGGGYSAVNKALRTLGQTGAVPLDRKLELAVRLTISGINCIDRAKRGFVVRGATLKPEAIARYKVGGLVVERAFTSTSMADEVHTTFQGNVEFRIIDASGANLVDLSYNGEEGEGEMLLQAGSLFKVISNEVDGGVTVIELQQVH